MRERLQTVLSTPGWRRTLLWLAAPLLSLVLPGAGALLAFVWISALLWFGRQPAALIGLTRPQRGLTRTVAGALLLAIALSALSSLLLEPLIQHALGQGADLSRLDKLTGNWSQLGLLIAVSWLVGAVVEETVFRGFLIGYGAHLFGERYVWPLAALSSILFGISHLYQGPAGMLLTGVMGFILSATYLLSRKNLVLAMLTHGLIDTIGIVGIFLGFR